MNFKIKRNEYGDIIACDSCSTETATTLFDNKRICEVCATSFIGNNDFIRNNAVTGEVLAQVANLIISKIEKIKNPK